MTDHLNRRSVLASAVAVAAATATVGEAQAKTVDVKIDANNLSPEMKKKHAVRFPKLDDEGRLNFSEGIRRWQLADKEGKAAVAGRQAYLESTGHSLGETKLSHEEAWNVLMQYPPYAARTRIEWANHDLMYENMFSHLHKNRDMYLAAMDATDKAGPGKLELNPDMALPEYTTHEIHRMPGGYVGDPFAGFAYHWTLTEAYYGGSSRYDELHTRMAQACRVPATGDVNRILDIGCSAGMSTTAFKERFPDAEVWGIDVAGPMVRYAHHRSAKMRLGCNFAQRLAEDSKFPDNHFDVVFDFLLTHEVTIAAAKKIASEMFRVMRPGAVWMHNDLPREDNPKAGLGHTIEGKAHVWNTHRHNYEPWYFRYAQDDFPGMLKAAGFDVQVDNDPRGGFIAAVYATKPV